VLSPKTQTNLKNAKGYFEEHLCVGDYYAECQCVQDEWFGEGAALLGLNGKVSRDQFLALCENQHPASRELLTQRQNTTRQDGVGEVANRRVFYDFTFSPPKSVSIATLVGGDQRIIAAHNRAVKIALKELEQFAGARVRARKSNSDRRTGNIVAALFQHDTSRALDPHLHTHCIIFNATHDDREGCWKALQNYEMLGAQKYAENVYYHELAHALRACGYTIVNAAHGDFEIAEISRELCDRFSKRHREIDEKTRAFLALHPKQTANYILPAVSTPSVGCIGGTWTPSSLTNAPSPREFHTAVWTGSEMIVWGGFDGSSYFNTGGRYNPTTDSWTATSTTNAPTGRRDHTAVWTGSEMIVWGGYSGNSYLNTGGRYDPTADSWTATSTTNAPTGRSYHTAVWDDLGNVMIVWGGSDSSGYFNSGGRYNPGTDSWTATSTSNAPEARDQHRSVWDDVDRLMIVWAGYNGHSYLNTGGKYNPITNRWTATSTTNAPEARITHTAVWTGSEMIVWGGNGCCPTYFNTGGRYNPTTDSWTATSTTNAPTGRIYHTALWTNSQMIVWGGGDASTHFNTGGRYCVQSGAPTPTPTATPTSTATPTPTPAVTTNPATNVASFSAALNGSLNPRGSTTTVYFQFGLTTSYGSTTPMQTQTGNTIRAISANISGLAASHVYHFRIVAHNGGGTAFGSDRTFTTLSATGVSGRYDQSGNQCGQVFSYPQWGSQSPRLKHYRAFPVWKHD